MLVYSSEADAKKELTDIIKNYTNNFQVVVYEREDINASRYKAVFAARMNSEEINENIISDIKRLNSREGKRAFFEGSRLDLQSDLAVSFLIASAEIKCNL